MAAQLPIWRWWALFCRMRKRNVTQHLVLFLDTLLDHECFAATISSAAARRAFRMYDILGIRRSLGGTGIYATLEFEKKLGVLTSQQTYLHTLFFRVNVRKVMLF